MSDVASHDETALLLQILDDLRVRVLDVLALVLLDLTGELARLVEWAGRDLILSHDAVRDRDPVIVFSEGRGLVDNTGTGRVGDVRIRNNAERSVLVLLSEVVEDGHVPPSDHVASLEGADLLELRLLFRVWLLLGVVTLVHRREEVLEQDEVLVALEVVDLDVGEVGVDTQAQVGGEGPRRGRPCKEGGRGVVDEGERNGDWDERLHSLPT